MEEWNKVIKLAYKYASENKNWRIGQSIFNATDTLYPDVANKIRGGENDCFYIDGRIDNFKQHFIKLVRGGSVQ